MLNQHDGYVKLSLSLFSGKEAIQKMKFDTEEAVV